MLKLSITFNKEVSGMKNKYVYTVEGKEYEAIATWYRDVLWAMQYVKMTKLADNGTIVIFQDELGQYYACTKLEVAEYEKCYC